MIRRDKLNLTDVAWSALLNPHVAAEFGATEIAGRIQQAAHQVIFREPDGRMQVFLQHGLAQPDPESQNSYFIDSDFAVEGETRVTDAQAILDSFNSEARRLFRWCITNLLHQALEPEPA
jgi:uncharacterized protein (TIGR04255 family)